MWLALIKNNNEIKWLINYCPVCHFLLGYLLASIEWAGPSKLIYRKWDSDILDGIDRFIVLKLERPGTKKKIPMLKQWIVVLLHFSTCHNAVLNCNKFTSEVRDRHYIGDSFSIWRKKRLGNELVNCYELWLFLHTRGKCCIG